MQARAAILAEQAGQHLLVSAAWCPHNGQVLMGFRERSYTVCKSKRGYSRGPTSVGTRDNVGIIVRCPPGSKPVAIFHTHPKGHPLPSPLDLRTTRQLGVPNICVKTGGKTRCFRVRRK